MRIFGFGKKESNPTHAEATETASCLPTPTGGSWSASHGQPNATDRCVDLVRQGVEATEDLAFQDAASHFSEALRIDSECVDALVGAGRLCLKINTVVGYSDDLLGAGSMEPAYWADRALEVNPLHPGAFTLMCQSAAQDRDFANVIAMAECMKASDIQTGEALYLLGWALGRVGREEEALEALEEAIGLADGWHTWAHFERAELLVRMGRASEAGPDYLAAARLKTGSSKFQQAAAYYFEEQGDLNSAAECYERGAHCDDTLDDIGPQMARSGLAAIRQRMAEQG